ncbi:MAG: Hpt domain-containing protein [Anaerolineales bacterium]|nr:Hpt domain-containing protein [Anaerolineales bacterium]
MSVLNLNTFDNLKQSAGAEFVNELMDAFFKDFEEQVGHMRNAIHSNDADSFRRAAHSIKSNALTFGAEELAALARELEMMGREKNLEAGNRLEVLKEAFESVKMKLNELR